MSDPVELPAWLETVESPPPPAKEPGPPEMPPKSKPRYERPTISDGIQRLLDQRQFALPSWTRPPRSRVRLRNLSIYVRQLALMLGAGVNLAKALEILGFQGEDPALKKASVQLQQDVLTGRSIGNAFSRIPKIFPPLLVLTIQSSELSGTLPAALLSLSEYYEKENRRMQKIRSSLVYPAFVFTFAVITFFVIIGYVFPVFAQFFEGLDIKLPLITRLLLGIFNLLVHPWFWLVALGAGFFLYSAWGALLKNPGFALRINIIQFRLPLIGPLTQKLIGIYFCRSLATMVSAGVHLLSALEILHRGWSMPLVKLLIYDLQEELRAGTSLSAYMKEQPIFPRVMADLAMIGEESGAQERLLSKAADYLEIEVESLLTTLTTLIEPALIIALGIMVGTILIGLFLPLYSGINQLR